MPVPGTSARRPSLQVKFHPWYGLFTLAYLVGIYWLSSLSDFGVGEGEPMVQLASNLFHIPLYAGLAFCVLQALSGAQGIQGVPCALSGLSFLGTAAYAALDEWHQAFVPGRFASVGDFLLDLVGIVGMLFILPRLGVDAMRLRQQSRARH